MQQEPVATRLKRIHYVTSNYPHFLSSTLGIGATLWLYGTLFLMEAVPVALISGVTFLVYIPAILYFMASTLFVKLAYGVVKFKKRDDRRRFWFYLTFMVTVVIATLLDINLSMPFSLFGLALTALLLGWCWTSPMHEFWRHYIPLAAAGVLVSLLPLRLLAGEGDYKWLGFGIGLTLMGLILMAGSIFDELLLLRTMKRPPRKDLNLFGDLEPTRAEYVRLALLAALDGCRYSDFCFLKRVTQLHEPELFAALYSLEQAGLAQVYTRKTSLLKRPNTRIYLTENGHDTARQRWQLPTQTLPTLINTNSQL